VHLCRAVEGGKSLTTALDSMAWHVSSHQSISSSRYYSYDNIEIPQPSSLFQQVPPPSGPGRSQKDRILVQASHRRHGVPLWARIVSMISSLTSTDKSTGWVRRLSRVMSRQPVRRSTYVERWRIASI
jgi:hypothetical protein